MTSTLEIRPCQCCKIPKPASDFGISRRDVGGVNPVCKACNNSRSRAYNKEHGQRRVAAQIAARIKSPETFKARYARWSSKPENKAKKKAYEKMRYANNKERHKAVVKRYRSKPGVAEKLRAYRRALMQTIDYKIKNNTKIRIRRLIGRSSDRGSKTFDRVGLPNVEALKKHLEGKFKPGMNWENYGFRGWHIDHIKPLSKFDLTDPKQLEKAFHYTNLQPLWWHENLSKGNRFTEN